MQKVRFTSIRLPFSFQDLVLATGSETKTSFAFLSKKDVFVSNIFDDLKEPKISGNFKKAILKNLKKFSPAIIACDLHPEYISTKYAKEVFEKARKRKKKLSLLEIQHHHAHIATSMAENGLRGKVIGVALDGTGYGTDGNIWGGEFLIANYHKFDRVAHFAYVPMPGAGRAVIEPVRMAFSYLYRTYKGDIYKLKSGVLKRIGKKQCSFFAKMIDKNLNSPLTSSAGRLFDAVSALLGVRYRISYEGEAAIELERIADADCSDIYKFRIDSSKDGIIVAFEPMIKAIMSDLKIGKPEVYRWVRQ
jgi:hydrogenase maturation protein HypF